VNKRQEEQSREKLTEKNNKGKVDDRLK